MIREVTEEVEGCTFRWNPEKAASHIRKHGIAFTEALEVLFDPNCRAEDASVGHEERYAIIGYSDRDRLLSVVVADAGNKPGVQSPPGSRLPGRENAMKKKLILHKDRPMKHISIRVPEDVLQDLKRVAPLKGMSGYQALIKFYLGQGLRKDLRELWDAETSEKLETVLVECGVDPEQREEILARLKEEAVAMRS